MMFYGISDLTIGTKGGASESVSVAVFKQASNDLIGRRKEDGMCEEQVPS